VELQKGPLGLLGWFALKVTGHNPPLFGDAVVPVVEMGDNYLLTSELQIKQPAAGVNTGTVASWSSVFTVTSGKVWRVLGAGSYVALNAADVAIVIDGSVWMLSPNSGPVGIPLFGRNPPQVAQNLRTAGCTFRPPLVVPSGWAVQLRWDASAALTVSVPWFPSVLVQEIDL